MLVTDCGDEAARLRYLASQARMPELHYEHVEVGYNYRLSNILAALGRAQLARLDDFVLARRRNFCSYSEQFQDLPGVLMMPEPKEFVSNRWLTCVTVDPASFGASANDIIHALSDANIEARPLWKPMHQQPVFKDCKSFCNGVSDRLFQTGLCLPSGVELQYEDLNTIASIFKGAGATGKGRSAA